MAAHIQGRPYNDDDGHGGHIDTIHNTIDNGNGNGNDNGDDDYSPTSLNSDGARARLKRSLKRFVSRDPNACQLCGYVDTAALNATPPPPLYQDTDAHYCARECPRCGLSDALDNGSSPYYFTEAAVAHRLKLFGSLTPLPSELVDLVVDYLLWFRGPTDFMKDDQVDAQDFKGKWYIATVVKVQDDRILVNFHGWSSKWDTWFHRSSTSLAPRGTYTKYTSNNASTIAITNASHNSAVNYSLHTSLSASITSVTGSSGGTCPLAKNTLGYQHHTSSNPSNIYGHISSTYVWRPIPQLIDTPHCEDRTTTKISSITTANTHDTSTSNSSDGHDHGHGSDGATSTTR